MALPAIFRMLRPKTFLYLISLRTGTEMIALTLLINKVSGIYGLLAILTGYHLSWLQLTMYIYSIGVLGALVYLSPHIKRQSPLQCLALAWLYVLDSLINATYTALFGTTWFLMLARHINDPAPGDDDKLPGGKMMNDTAGFTSPEVNATRVEVVATPAMPGQKAVAVGVNDGSALGHAVFQSGSIASISVICALWTIRIYFCLVVMAYARGVLRQHILMTSSNNFGLHGGSERTDLAENPFREGREEGEGWKGRLGRIMTSVGKGYWLGKDDEDEWVRGTGERFTNKKRLNIKVPEPGVGERERRARSGTGPPPMVKKQEASS
ncbi:DUF1753-domain-containing protein [Aureobasidium pullulans]|nr:DUF1753-domain-containing protein [Aureobasidium pullulans]